MEYQYIKVIHIIAVISWMAGMLYLPRLFVYHVKAKAGGELDLTLQTMERKLQKFIMLPALIVAFVTGFWLASIADSFSYGWFHGKLLFVVLMAAAHGIMGRYRKDFANGANKKSERFFRYFNEVPTILMILIVILVVVKPF